MDKHRTRLRPGEPMCPPFTPVPMDRNRRDGWTPDRQRQFLLALSVTGSVEAAARMCSISRKSAYALRKREGARSFARAWDVAVAYGRARLFDYLMDRAINGVTTIRLRMGGVVDIGHGPDNKLVAAHFKQPLEGVNPFAGKGDKG